MNEDGYVDLNTLKFDGDGELVKTWQCCEISGNSRIYYKPSMLKSGFVAYFIEDVSCGNDGERPNLVTAVFKTIAYWDGVRHMYFNASVNDGGEGYLNYPDLPSLTRALVSVQELEKQYCQESGRGGEY